MVSVNPHDPGADRPHDEAHSKHGSSRKELGGLVSPGEEARRKIKREGRVDIPVEPFDQVAGRAADNIDQALPLALERYQEMVPASEGTASPSSLRSSAALAFSALGLL